MKGIILAGGSGTRFYPVTTVVSKQLLPVFDKPMIYYPLSTLMLGGIREILVISTPQDRPFSDVCSATAPTLGLHFSYAVQETPTRPGRRFHRRPRVHRTDSVALVLGDNIFYGHGLPEMLAKAAARASGATVFGYVVNTPEAYGVVELDDFGPGAVDRGETQTAKIQCRGDRALFLRQ